MSNDCETWYEASDEQLCQLLDDDSVDCWVDWSSKPGYCFIRLSAVRKLMQYPEPEVDSRGRPLTLCGVPVKWSDG